MKLYSVRRLISLLWFSISLCIIAFPAWAADYNYSIQSGGLLRYYDVHIPSSYDGSSPVPLVLDFHGFTGNSAIQRFLTGWEAKSDQKGFIVVFPQGWGTTPSWNAETCCGEANLFGLDDVGLARDIVTDVMSHFQIDSNRIYATGHSNGGALSHLIGCEAADLFAAVAPVSYHLPVWNESSCLPERPMPVIHFHGFSDLIVSYWFGIAPVLRSASESFTAWKDVNKCTGSPKLTYYQLGSLCMTYDSCEGGAEVTLCSIQSGHTPYFNASFVNIPDLAWDFFEDHPMPTD